MKKLFCIAALLGFINHSFAQNSNPWPTTGNVGIGTATPTTALQVVGDIRFGSNGTYTDLRLSPQTPLSGYNQTNIITSLTAPASGTAKAALYLKNAGSVGITRMDLLVDGNVGIGAINPQNKLVVAQANSLVPAALIQDSGTGDAGLAFNVSGASFTWGIDQSDEKKFKLSNSTTLGTNDYITVTNTTGNVGIGTTAPNGKLDVVNNFASGTGGSALIVNAKGSGSSNGTTIYGAQVNASTLVGSSSTQTVYGMDVNAAALGTGPSPLTAVNANAVLSRLSGSTATAYYGGKFQLTGATGTSTASNVSSYGLYGEVANTNATGEISNSYGVYGKAATVASATAYGGYFTATGGTNNYGVYSAAGTNYFNDNVIIGTATVPAGYKLAVNGSVIATAVTVKLYAGWPDYVFKKDYRLPTLTEVKDYIDKNSHLPDMPSEKEIVDNGLNLGEMNKILAKKVEELTLYLIEKDHQVNSLKNDVDELKEQLKRVIKNRDKITIKR